MLTLAGELRHLYQVSFACMPSVAGQNLLKRAACLGRSTLAIDLAANCDAQHQLYTWFVQNHIDLLHCHAGIGWEGHQAIRIARMAGVPAILRTEHLPYLLTDPEQRMEHRKTVELVDRLVCVSDEARRSFLKQGLSREKLVTIRNGITVPAVHHGAGNIRERLELHPQAKVVLTVARFTEQKGHKYLLQAIPDVLAIEPAAHFVWVGTGPLAGTLKEAVRDRGLEQYVSFPGSRDDARELMAGAEVFVLPSRFEGLPLVVLEAMAAGVPVIGTRVCGIREIIRDRASGRLVPFGDSQALSTAILEVLANPKTSEMWVRRARQRVERSFNLRRMVDETVAIYRQLLPATPPAITTVSEIFT